MSHLVLCSNSVVVASAVILSHSTVLSWIPPLDHSSSSHTRHSRNIPSSWKQHYCSVHSWSYTLQVLHGSTSQVLSQSQNSYNTWKDLRRCPSFQCHEMPISSCYSTIDTSRRKCSLNRSAWVSGHQTTSSPTSNCTHSSNTHDLLLPTLKEQPLQKREQHHPLGRKQTHQHLIPWTVRRCVNRNHCNKGTHVCRECSCNWMEDMHCKEPLLATASLKYSPRLQEQREQSQISTEQWREGHCSWW